MTHPFLSRAPRAGLAAWAASSWRRCSGAACPSAPWCGARTSAPRRCLRHPPTDSYGEGPRVSFARAGLTVSWDSKFQRLLELAEACDVPMRWSCRAGVRHTCECGLISGSVKYDPEPLEPAAAGNLLICCSRPQEDVVIDIEREIPI